MKDIISHLKPHADGEEQNDLPALQKVIGTDGALQAAKSFQRTKKFVPTRLILFIYLVFAKIKD